MDSPFQVIVVEGALEVPAVKKLLACCGVEENVPEPIDKRGRDNFWAAAVRYNRAAEICGVLALADLEAEPCASKVFEEYLPVGRHPNFVLRLAVRMLESWLLADRKAMADFLKVPLKMIPQYPDRETHPKRTLVNVARKSKSRSIKLDVVPAEGMSAVVGPNYFACLSTYIERYWQPMAAGKNSPSLDRALQALRRVIGS